MGKISDAFDKFKKEHKNSGIVNKNFNVVKKDHLSESTSHDITEELIEHGKLDENLITLFKPGSFEAEQFKVLKTNLLFPVSGKPPRIMMVTSAAPEEGKSFVAANLAVSIAQNINDHVLLMDCDIRKPKIHKYFGFHSVPGLSEYLSQKTPLPSLLLKTEIDKLTILPAGKPPHNPSELLSSEQMSHLLQEVKAKYKDRYIIIDSPPPQLTAEAGALSRQVDGIILVIRSRNTSRDIIKEIVEMLGKEKILGVIFNRYDISILTYLGHGKYSNYNKHYGKK